SRLSICPTKDRRIKHHSAWQFLFLNIIRMKFAIAVELNDHRTVLRRNKMRYAGRNENETARGVPFQLCGFEFRSLAHIPGPSMMVASSSCGCVCARTHLRRES